MTLKEKAYAIGFDLATGLSESKTSTKRYLADMKKIFNHVELLEDSIQKGNNHMVYEYYSVDADVPKTDGDLHFGTSVVYPGKVGDEYYMTKGHFHEVLETGEVYLCLSGEGYMLMENPEGDWQIEKFIPGQAVHVPPRYAHRSINIGNEPLVTFFTFRADAGHDYGTIETKGYRKLVVEKDGQPEIIDNPNWEQ